jgi:hypothetical protein
MLQFNISGRDNTGKNSLGAVPNVEFTYPIVVEGIPLPELVARSGLTRIDLVKIDVEGAEFDLLESGQQVLLEQPELIMVLGVHPENLEAFDRTDRDVWNLLTSWGFSMLLPEWPGRNTDVLEKLEQPPHTRRPYTLMCIKEELVKRADFLGDYRSRIRARLNQIAPDRAHGRGVTL